ncbi:TPA: hypothetical protein I8Y21_004412 [Klebsiella oxytoca]|uniref:Uncharacterized protein n=1 Tax=Klebsiella oxytoca TaxID=571 RepID=A0AAN5RFH1_KLEOX|nr:hypothetical protein [Klebsiella oxytoca]
MTQPQTSSRSQADAGEDLSVLLPDREVRIAGESVTIREYTLQDALTLHALLAPVVEALASVTENAWASYDAVEAVLASQHDAVIPLVAHSISRSPAFVAGLSGSEGMTLMDWWWSVNRHFFMNAVIRRLVCRQVTASASAGSSRSSSGPAPLPED